MTGIQITVQKINGKTEYGKNILMAVCFMTGWSRLLGDAFLSMEAYWWVFALLGSSLCIGILLLYDTGAQPYLFLSGIGIVFVGFGISFLFFKDGILSLSDDVLRFLTGKTGKIYLDYPVEHTNDVYVIMVWLELLFALWIAKAIRFREKTVMIFLMLMLTVAAGCGFVKTEFGFLLVFAAVAIFFLTEQATAPVWAGVLVCILCAGCLLRGEDFTVGKVSKAVRAKVHEWRYESGNVGMPEGDLSNLNALERDDSAALEIQMEEPQKLYLRGMTGEVYRGTGWEPMDENTYIAAEDTFYWLHKMGFYGQTTIAAVLDMTENEKSSQMQIHNIGACQKYQYLPYALAGHDVLDAAVIGDGTVSAVNQEICISYVPGSVPMWYQAKIKLVGGQEKEPISDYLKKEQTYREFVYEQDLQLTNEAIGVCQRMLGDAKDSMTLPEITTLIRDTLEEKLEYSEAVVTRNGSNDFLQYTLEQSKKGYSVHYATAAVLMLRYCGVPARYVEGYYLSSEEAANYKKGDTILLCQSHAHAWAEYYLDGIGWIPFEVTPGYVDEEELTALQNMYLGGTNGNGVGHSYEKSRLSYRPPLENKKEKQAEKQRKLFSLTWQWMLKLFVVLLMLALSVYMYRIMLRYRTFKQMIVKIKQADNDTAIAMLYSYAQLLQKYTNEWQQVNEVESAHQRRIRELNQEAMFSSHEMTVEQRRKMEAYTKEILFVCRSQWSSWKQFYYHYILWLYE